MQATKYTLQINIECLSKDSMFGLISKACDQISDEVDSGTLHHDDGDEVSWEITTEQVEF